MEQKLPDASWKLFSFFQIRQLTCCNGTSLCPTTFKPCFVQVWGVFLCFHKNVRFNNLDENFHQLSLFSVTSYELFSFQLLKKRNQEDKPTFESWLIIACQSGSKATLSKTIVIHIIPSQDRTALHEYNTHLYLNPTLFQKMKQKRTFYFCFTS